MYHQRQTSPVAMQSLSGQRLVDLAFIVALIAILVVVALSLLGPAIGNTVTSTGSGLDSPAPALTTTHSEQGAVSSSIYLGGQVDVAVMNAAPR